MEEDRGRKVPVVMAPVAFDEDLVAPALGALRAGGQTEGFTDEQVRSAVR